MSRTDSDVDHVHSWDRGNHAIMCDCLQIVPIDVFRRWSGRAE